MDDLTQLLNDMFQAWKDDVESVDIPEMVSDDQACDIIAAALRREPVRHRIVKRVLKNGWNEL